MLRVTCCLALPCVVVTIEVVSLKNYLKKMIELFLIYFTLHNNNEKDKRRFCQKRIQAWLTSCETGSSKVLLVSILSSVSSDSSDLT